MTESPTKDVDSMEQEETVMRISVKSEQYEIIYELNNSTAANELYAQLPLTTEVEPFSNNEMTFYPEKLDVTGTPFSDGEPGSLSYYEPWGDVVMFYASCTPNNSLYELGKAVSGAEHIENLSGTITRVLCGVKEQSMKEVQLSNGVAMPQEGFGVFQVPESECKEVVLNAIRTGYRLIDTASSYKNEEAVGAAIQEAATEGIVKRDELFIATKAYIQEMGYKNLKDAFARSLDKLGLDYLDLYLIHMPLGDYYGAWRAMEELYREGKIRAIGVCNFDAARLMGSLLQRRDKTNGQSN